MAKTVKKTAKVETAFGNPIDPLTVGYEYEELQKGDAIPADEYPNEDAIRGFVNQRRNSAARAKAQNEALSNAGIVKPTLEDPDVRLKTMVKVLLANGMDEATAETTARAALGM